ncbi:MULTISPECIES: RecQ family ATP-dependent DNA helicase [Clostridia]|uniref:RecQ family ATP-dependent DNA helicase n=1 Tax=Clostridia TaxID=186801 RepID=UPI000EA19267|nr:MULTISPECIES: RecQ family ATP-dependent DNA helicase [Clostridia]NBJ70464.1 ATP-dependent DNA helicase RecQ [Roseburia sp. 1XD42-34]RKI76119.1 ATP-dependent DNA helicase RecQ [Clostridium sp. 1xD42-85]
MQQHVDYLKQKLTDYFGYDSFRQGQLEIIDDILTGKNVLGVLPTGSGKSVCYQLPAMLLDGITIVVSPLISLMIDQVKQLKAKRWKRVAAINSFMDRKEREQVLQSLHTYQLIYVSPELMQQEMFQIRLKTLHVRLFVIDEAHCISQWGHEFRPDYMRLKQIIAHCNYPPILALSATATPKVQTDIIDSLGGLPFTKHIYPIDRTNMAFCIQKVEVEQEKVTILTEILQKYRVPSLIYFSSRQKAEEVAVTLASKLNRRIAVYHGGMEQHDRISIQQQFMSDQIDVVCCTSAFGMGINKPDIRLIIHYHLTTQMESYIQEVGRAGRDGAASVSLLLYCNKDIQLPKFIISRELPEKHELVTIFQQLKLWYDQKKRLPLQEEEMTQQLNISEIQWRFIRYHLEKHGIIKQNQIYYHSKKWKKVYQQIDSYVVKRNKIKEAKLTHVLNWVHQTDCLRKHLYKEFQLSYHPATFQCCSNCGFSWENWNPPQKQTPDSMNYSWQEKLKQKLLIGAIYETE